MSLKNNMYDINVYDNIVPKYLHSQIWKYLEKQTWHIKWLPVPALPAKLNRFKPIDGPAAAFNTVPIVQSASFHRTCLAIDEPQLKIKHKLIWDLWQKINAGLNNEYEITGYPEGMADKAYSEQHGLDGWGWRVYANGLYGRFTGGTHGAHRDTPDLNDETSVTILYIVNQEWYPRWGGEFVYFPEDPQGLTGDHQQFNIGDAQQKRGYNVGWPDQGKIVSPVPNRVIVYDGRCLHNCQPVSADPLEKPLWRVVFRARKKQK